jgi:hypothetical protein
MNIPSLKEVIHSLKEGNRDFNNILKLPAEKFEDASFEMLMANEHDILAGVNKVRMRFDVNCFGAFTDILMKFHDNGDIKVVFYGSNSDVDAIFKLFELLTGQLGAGIFNQEKFLSFRDRENINRVATSQGFGMGMDVVHSWSLAEDISILLQYCQVPRHQFSLMITIHKPQMLDHSKKDNGTIADLLAINIYDLLNETLYNGQAESEMNEYGVLDYHLKLDRKELDYFTSLTISFGTETVKEGELPRFNIELFHTGSPDMAKIRSIAEQLISLYGSDSNACGELEPYEWEKIDNNEFWTGRTWEFNPDHALCQNPEDELTYYVRMNNMGDSQGFKVSIVSANKLYELFN